MTPELNAALPLVFVTLAALVAALCDLGADYRSPHALPGRFGLWHFRQDEKLIVPDARGFARLSGDPARLGDFEPPNSAAFGPGSHLLAALGIRLFGPGPFGLRFFPLLAGMGSLFLFAFSATRMAPGPAGTALALALLTDLELLSLARLALVEHYLHFTSFFLFAYYLATPASFAAHPSIAGAAAGAMVLFKPNFPFFCLLVPLAAFLLGGSGDLGALFPAFALSLVFFEGVNFLVLARYGIAARRYGVITKYLREFSGREGTPVATRFFPAGFGAPADFATYFFEFWFLPRGLGERAGALTRRLLALPLLAVLILAVRGAQGIHGQMGPAVAAVVSFAIPIISAPLTFTLKRAVLPIMLFALAVVSVLGNLLPEGGGAALAFAVGAVWAWRQFVFLTLPGPLRTPPRKRGGLSGLLPSGSAVYAHCYAGRYFWAESGIRLISADDNARTNADTLALAVAERGTYALLSARGSPVSPEDAGGASLAVMAVFRSEENETDEEDIFLLLRLEYDGLSRFPAELKEAGLDGRFPPEAGPLTADLEKRPLSPSAARRAYNAASRLENMGRTREALRLFRAVEGTGFNPAGVAYHLAALYRAEGMNADAARHAARALGYSPNHRAARALYDSLKHGGAA